MCSHHWGIRGSLRNYFSLSLIWKFEHGSVRIQHLHTLALEFNSRSPRRCKNHFGPKKSRRICMEMSASSHFMSLLTSIWLPHIIRLGTTSCIDDYLPPQAARQLLVFAPACRVLRQILRWANKFTKAMSCNQERQQGRDSSRLYRAICWWQVSSSWVLDLCIKSSCDTLALTWAPKHDINKHLGTISSLSLTV